MKFYFDEEKQQEVLLISDHIEMLTVETKTGKRYHAKSKFCAPLAITCFSPDAQAIIEPAKEVIQPVLAPEKEPLINLINRSAPKPTKRAGVQIKLF